MEPYAHLVTITDRNRVFPVTDRAPGLASRGASPSMALERHGYAVGNFDSVLISCIRSGQPARRASATTAATARAGGDGAVQGVGGPESQGRLACRALGQAVHGTVGAQGVARRAAKQGGGGGGGGGTGAGRRTGGSEARHVAAGPGGRSRGRRRRNLGRRARVAAISATREGGSRLVARWRARVLRRARVRT